MKLMNSVTCVFKITVSTRHKHFVFGISLPSRFTV